MRNSEEYSRILAKLEEVEIIGAYEPAKASGETPVPFSQAIELVEDLLR